MTRCCACLALLVCVTPRPALADVSLTGIHTTVEGNSTRVLIDLSSMTRYQYGILPADPRTGKPPRVYVDVHGVSLGSRDNSVLNIGDVRLARIRAGQHKDGVARIVMEVQGAITPKIVQVDTPPRIVVELTGIGLDPGKTASATESPGNAPASDKLAAAGAAVPGNSSGRETGKRAVSPEVLAKLQSPRGDGPGVVTLKGGNGANASEPAARSGATEVGAVTPKQAESPAVKLTGADSSKQDARSGPGPGPGPPEVPVVAGRGTTLQALPNGPSPPRATGSTRQSTSLASQIPASTGASSDAAVPRPPLQPGRGTDLLPLPPLPPGQKPVQSAGADGPKKARQIRVVIDPGHGGKDPGAQGPAGNEKDSVLDIALRVASKLRKNLGIDVRLTRSEDTYVPLGARKDMANRLEADLFVSIHANASKNADLAGIETYYLKNSNDRATLRLARLENGVDMLIKGNDVSTDADLNYILSDIIQGQKESDSVLLANHIQGQLCSNLEKRYDSIRSLGVKQGPFMVLDGTFMPAVLVETGFITSNEEGRRLNVASYRESVADGIYRGIKAYLEDERVNDLT